LEFKLFALRHPEAHARLRGRHRRIRASFGELFSEIMGALGKTICVDFPGASACLGAVSQGCCWNTCWTPRRCRMATSTGFWPFSIRFFKLWPG
jgi:hypothetical protein